MESLFNNFINKLGKKHCHLLVENYVCTDSTRENASKVLTGTVCTKKQNILWLYTCNINIQIVI